MVTVEPGFVLMTICTRSSLVRNGRVARRRFGVVGFHTYGEQYNAMHLNQTLTGIAFGRGGAS